MILKRINRASPEQVFVIVRNNDAVTLSTGHAVVYDYVLGGTTGDGYSVRIPRTAATTVANPGLFAGLIAGRDVAPQDYGSVQCYGHADYAVVTGTATEGFVGAAVAWNDTSMSNIILRPANALGVTVHTATTAGYLGVCNLTTILYGTTNDATAKALIRPLWPGGFCVPVDKMYNAATPTTYNTLTTDSTGFCKVFIRCL